MSKLNRATLSASFLLLEVPVLGGASAERHGAALCAARRGFEDLRIALKRNVRVSSTPSRYCYVRNQNR